MLDSPAKPVGRPTTVWANQRSQPVVRRTDQDGLIVLRADTRDPSSRRYSPSDQTIWGELMFEHVAGRQRRSRWAILSFLFALAFAWSFAVMGERSGVWSILRLGLAVGLGFSLLRLVLTLVSSRTLRRGQENEEWRAEADEGADMEAEGQPSAEEPPTEKHALTYEEVFQVQPNIDLGSLPPAAEGDEGADMEAEEGADMEAEGQPPADEPPAEDRAPTSDEEDLQVLQPDSDGAVDQVEAPEADVESQDSLQRMREEFKARAKEAELRVKQREAELDEAASAPKSKR